MNSVNAVTALHRMGRHGRNLGGSQRQQLLQDPAFLQLLGLVDAKLPDLCGKVGRCACTTRPSECTSESTTALGELHDGA